MQGYEVSREADEEARLNRDNRWRGDGHLGVCGSGFGGSASILYEYQGLSFFSSIIASHGSIKNIIITLHRIYWRAIQGGEGGDRGRITKLNGNIQIQRSRYNWYRAEGRATR